MPLYRFRGDVGGVERCYSLARGEASVGSVRENDIVLPVRGVSRRHALLSPGTEGLNVEDLESKNGILVNGRRVRRASLRPGDEVHFGPVALRLEEIPAEDADLAIVLQNVPAPKSGLPSWQTTEASSLSPATSTPAAVRGLAFPEGYVAGESPSMSHLYDQLRPLLHGDLPVLILGETGVGKECVARILHASSGRGRGPFVAVNCAAIPADLLEAEMFGIGKGVATGVVERQGKFQLAQGGTLLLDEITEMPLGLQAKLLRALQEKEIQPVGGTPVAVDIRVVAASNTDLTRRIEEGGFRRDLYYRVAGYVLKVPALRERKEDLPALIEGFIRASSRDAGKPVRGITVKALRALVEYGWPGNIRELQHEVRRLVYMCPESAAIDSTMISAHVLSPASAEGLAPSEPGVSGAGEGLPESEELRLEAHVQRVEERLIRQALERAGGNRSQAAKLLGISRNGLAIKMRRLGIRD